MEISGTFNLEADSSWSQSQTRDIQLDADTTGAPVTVNLPSVAEVDAVNGRGARIVVNDLNGNAAGNNITVVADAGAGDDIEGAANHVINTNDDVVIFTIGGDNRWKVEA